MNQDPIPGMVNRPCWPENWGVVAGVRSHTIWRYHRPHARKTKAENKRGTIERGKANTAIRSWLSHFIIPKIEVLPQCFWDSSSRKTSGYHPWSSGYCAIPRGSKVVKLLFVLSLGSVSCLSASPGHAYHSVFKFVARQEPG